MIAASFLRCFGDGMEPILDVPIMKFHFGMRVLARQEVA